MTGAHQETPTPESSPAQVRAEQLQRDEVTFAEIERKMSEGQDPTSAELRLLYAVDRESYYDEELVEELRDMRNPELDMPRAFECEPDQIAHSVGEINEHTVAYVGPILCEGMFRRLPANVRYVYTAFPNGRIEIEHLSPDPNVRRALCEQLDASELEALVSIFPPARTLLQQGVFNEDAVPKETALVRLSLADMGLRGSVHWGAIYRRARLLGLEPCVPDAALSYWHRGLGHSVRDTLHIGMEPMATKDWPEDELIFALQRPFSDNAGAHSSLLSVSYVDFDKYLYVNGESDTYEFLFAQSAKGPMTEEEILALPEEDALELFALPGYLPFHAVIRKAFGVTEFVPSDDQHVLNRDELGLSRSDKDKADRWVNYCWDGILPESGISASTYEFWNEEHLVALADHIADTARSIGTQGTEQVTVLEVGAGNGRLSHFLREKLKTRCGDTVRVIGVDNGSWKLRPMFPVEKCEHAEALAKYKPAIVLFSWMPRDVDITPDICATPCVQEVLLIGETEGGCCGGPWASEASTAVNDGKVGYAEHGFRRIDLDDLSAKQVCRTDLPGHFMHSHTVSLRRTM